MKTYSPPSLKALGDVASLTGFSGSTTQQDVVIQGNGTILGLPGPSSEFACQIPNPTSEECQAP